MANLVPLMPGLQFPPKKRVKKTVENKMVNHHSLSYQFLPISKWKNFENKQRAGQPYSRTKEQMIIFSTSVVAHHTSNLTLFYKFD